MSRDAFPSRRQREEACLNITSARHSHGWVEKPGLYDFSKLALKRTEQQYPNFVTTTAPPNRA